MSLADSLDKFKSERATVVSRNLAHARPATTSNTPQRAGTPKPLKRDHDTANAGPPLAPNAGNEIMKLVVNAVSHMKERGASRMETFDEIVRFSSLPTDLRGPRGIARFKQALQMHHQLQYVPASEGKDKKESFKYKPRIPVTNGEELREYLARLDSASGVNIKDLKDGWPDCTSTLDDLERQGFILVSRKKDNTPRAIFPDNPGFHITTPVPGKPAEAPQIANLDPDFVSFWNKVKLPANESDMRSELERAGLTPTSAVKEVKKVDGRKKERKRVDRKNTKKTNTHMTGILVDYNKPAGKR